MSPISSSDKLPTATSSQYYISVEDIDSRLKAIKKSKLPGPDSIPNWLLRDFSVELAAPIASIFNACVIQAQIPTQWEKANVIPIPKTQHVQDINKDFRPISLTPTLSKILESFFATGSLNPFIKCTFISFKS